MDFSQLTEYLESATRNRIPAIQMTVLQDGNQIYCHSAGYIDPETRQHPVNGETLFDLASVTKLCTTSAFMRAVESGLVSLDQPVSTILSDFIGQRPIRGYEDPLKWGDTVQPAVTPGQTVDAGKTTFRELLAHNSGLPAWRAFKDEADADAAKRLALNTTFFYPPGTRVVYSDVGLILLGMSLEKLYGERLDQIIRKLVTEPLGLSQTTYLPIGETVPGIDYKNIAPTEFCKWRGRRIQGQVHDESTYRLDGIAGHAGLFSNATELAKFGQAFIDPPKDFLQPETITEMRRRQSIDGDVRRGIGFALWCPDPDASSNPLSPSAFGHTGFTGTELWVDPDRRIVIAQLTNEVYFGREDRVIMAFRVNAHRLLLGALAGTKGGG